MVCECSNGISYTWKYDVNISKAAGLSLTYTNHCVRATTAIVLAHSGVSSLEIMSVTGHRDEKSIQSYVNAPSVSHGRQYSETLQRVATGVVRHAT